jgi:hypothetical protein
MTQLQAGRCRQLLDFLLRCHTGSSPSCYRALELGGETMTRVHDSRLYKSLLPLVGPLTEPAVKRIMESPTFQVLNLEYAASVCSLAEASAHCGCSPPVAACQAADPCVPHVQLWMLCLLDHRSYEFNLTATPGCFCFPINQLNISQCQLCMYAGRQGASGTNAAIRGCRHPDAPAADGLGFAAPQGWAGPSMPTALTFRGNHRSSKQLRASGRGLAAAEVAAENWTLQSCQRITGSGRATTIAAVVMLASSRTARRLLKLSGVLLRSVQQQQKLQCGMSGSGSTSSATLKCSRRPWMAMICLASKATHERPAERAIVCLPVSHQQQHPMQIHQRDPSRRLLLGRWCGVAGYQLNCHRVLHIALQLQPPANQQRLA